LNKLFTFIRIPKNASTSIYRKLGKLNTITDDSMSILADSNTHRGIFAPSHCRLSQAVEVLGKDILDKIVFTVVRNPFDRMVSQYFFALKQKLVKFQSLENFIDFCGETKTIASLSQSYYLDIDTEINILRFENLEEDFKKLFEQNGIGILYSGLGHINKTKHKPFQQYYNPTLRAKVKALWAEDFERFDYH
jgi:hypothetical protein